jgi:hypothetical protein
MTKRFDEGSAISERYRRSMEPDGRMHARDGCGRGVEHRNATTEDYALRKTTHYECYEHEQTPWKLESHMALFIQGAKIGRLC